MRRMSGLEIGIRSGIGIVALGYVANERGINAALLILGGIALWAIVWALFLQWLKRRQERQRKPINWMRERREIESLMRSLSGPGPKSDN
jgi:hypothetical protein